MRKILVFGNSGAGKSTFSKKLSAGEGIAHLDLDTLAFKADAPTERRDVDASLKEVQAFIEEHDGWVVEGGYADLLEGIQNHASEVVYLDLPVIGCQENAGNRAWEPHKYASKEAQDKNLGMLLNWIQDYYSRNDAFSKSAHDKLFDRFSGVKERITSNR